MQPSLKQIKQFKAEAHNLKPLMTLGNKGITPNFIKEVVQALYDHELVKIRINAKDRNQIQEFIAILVDKTGATLVKKIGKTAVLYKLSDKNSSIKPKSSKHKLTKQQLNNLHSNKDR